MDHDLGAYRDENVRSVLKKDSTHYGQIQDAWKGGISQTRERNKIKLFLC
jgi:hypothetical protein